MGTHRRLNGISHIGFSREWCLRHHWCSLGYTDMWPYRKNWSRIRKINHRNKKRGHREKWKGAMCKWKR